MVVQILYGAQDADAMSCENRRTVSCAGCGKRIRTWYDEGDKAFCADCKHELKGTYSDCTNCHYSGYCQMIIWDLRPLPCQPNSGHEFEKVRAEPWIMEMG